MYSAVVSASTGHPVSLLFLFLALMRRLMRFLFLLRNMNIKKDFHSMQGKHLGATIGRRFAHTFTSCHQPHCHCTITCFSLVPVGLMPDRIAANYLVYVVPAAPSTRLNCDLRTAVRFSAALGRSACGRRRRRPVGLDSWWGAVAPHRRQSRTWKARYTSIRWLYLPTI